MPATVPSGLVRPFRVWFRPGFRERDPARLKKDHLVGAEVFFDASFSYERFHARVLGISNLERSDGALFWERLGEASHVLGDCVLTVTDAGVDGVLEHDVAIDEQEFAELGGYASLFLGFDREVEEHHEPHVAWFLRWHRIIRIRAVASRQIYDFSTIVRKKRRIDQSR